MACARSICAASGSGATAAAASAWFFTLSRLPASARMSPSPAVRSDRFALTPVTRILVYLLNCQSGAPFLRTKERGGPSGPDRSHQRATQQGGSHESMEGTWLGGTVGRLQRVGFGDAGNGADE